MEGDAFTVEGLLSDSYWYHTSVRSKVYDKPCAVLQGGRYRCKLQVYLHLHSLAKASLPNTIVMSIKQTTKLESSMGGEQQAQRHYSS